MANFTFFLKKLSYHQRASEPTAETRVQCQGSPCEIYSEQGHTGES
jgi:hypothetical protein